MFTISVNLIFYEAQEGNLGEVQSNQALFFHCKSKLMLMYIEAQIQPYVCKQKIYRGVYSLMLIDHFVQKQELMELKSNVIVCDIVRPWLGSIWIYLSFGSTILFIDMYYHVHKCC